MKLIGKSFVITGGESGIGRAIALAAADAGQAGQTLQISVERLPRINRTGQLSNAGVRSPAAGASGSTGHLSDSRRHCNCRQQ